MQAQGLKLIALGLLTLLFSATGIYAQYTTPEDAKDYINDRLSHSVLQKIDPDGTVTISAPSEKIKFKLRDVSFNYNGGNNDDRVRVFGDNCIEHYEHKILSEKTSRQSFVCESEKEANEVIAAFRFLKKSYPGDPKSSMAGDIKLKVSDSTLGTKTVSEAIDFINENLSYSMITGIDEQGVMTINSPDEIYRVNLKLAEFGYNDADDGSKLRIYGDFCIEVKKDRGSREFICRKSFQAPDRVKAYKVISVLYYLKATYSDLDPATIPWLKNVNGKRTVSYNKIKEAIDFINDRLSYSIILGIDKSGLITLNAPEEIYRFKLKEVKISKTDHRNTGSDWFNIRIPGDYAPGILVECNDCIKKYESPVSYDFIDEQVFQCRTMSDVKEVLKALEYLKVTPVL
jgi:hypothetical protein